MRAQSGVVEVWRVDLGDRSLDELTDGPLCPAERARAARIVRRDARVLWTRSRVTLRTLLARYVERDPRGLEFELGPCGKPGLAGETDLCFNLSHSGELMLVAVTAGAEVGVDVERARERYSARFLSEWTLREARVKCLGTGLAHAPERRSEKIGTSSEDPDRELWVCGLDLGPGTFGAVAVMDRPCELRLLDAQLPSDARAVEAHLAGGDKWHR